MADEKNSVSQLMDDVDWLGRFFTILLILCPSIAGALQAQNISSIWGLIILTAPFTLAVALQTYLVMKEQYHSLLGFMFWSCVLLAVLSLVSHWVGVGRAVDAGKIMQQSQQEILRQHNYTHNGREWILRPFFNFLGGYYDLYKPLTFWMSAACGMYLGYRAGREPKPAEKAAKPGGTSTSAGA